jgi:hypothetical protein
MLEASIMAKPAEVTRREEKRGFLRFLINTVNNLGASERLSEHQLDDLLAMHVEPVLAESFETIQILVRAVVHFVASLSQRGVDSVVVIAEEEAGLVLSSSLVHQNVDQTVSNPLDQTELRSVLAVNVTVQRTGAE